MNHICFWFIIGCTNQYLYIIYPLSMLFSFLLALVGVVVSPGKVKGFCVVSNPKHFSFTLKWLSPQHGWVDGWMDGWMEGKPSAKEKLAGKLFQCRYQQVTSLFLILHEQLLTNLMLNLLSTSLPMRSWSCHACPSQGRRCWKNH